MYHYRLKKTFLPGAISGFLWDDLEHEPCTVLPGPGGTVKVVTFPDYPADPVCEEVQPSPTGSRFITIDLHDPVVAGCILAASASKGRGMDLTYVQVIISLTHEPSPAEVSWRVGFLLEILRDLETA